GILAEQAAAGERRASAVATGRRSGRGLPIATIESDHWVAPFGRCRGGRDGVAGRRETTRQTGRHRGVARTRTRRLRVAAALSPRQCVVRAQAPRSERI